MLIKFMRSDGILVTSWMNTEPDCQEFGTLKKGEHDQIKKFQSFNWAMVIFS